jgi:hypothetical protein
MDFVCPHCHGTAYLLETGPDGRVMTICTKCETAVSSAESKDSGRDPEGRRPERKR